MCELRFAKADLDQARGSGFACSGARGHVPPRDPPIILCPQEQNLLYQKVSGCNAVWSCPFTDGA